MSRIRTMFGVFAFGLAAGELQATTLQVPTQFASIQAAIDAAAAGDEILLGPGTYAETLTILNKTLTIRGSGQPSDTVIRSGPGGALLSIESGSNVRLLGLSLRGGRSQQRELCGGIGEFGGAILASASSVEIQDCILAENNAELGGAVFLIGGQFTARRTTFSDNGTAPAGVSTVGAVLRTCDRSAPATILIEDSLVLRNGNPAQLGLNVISPFNGTLTIRRTRFEENRGSALRPFAAAVLDVSDCDFINNQSSSAAISIVGLDPGARVDVRSSRFERNDGSSAADIVAVLPGGASQMTILGCSFVDSAAGSVFATLQSGDSFLIDRSRFTNGQGPAIAFANDGGQIGLRNLLVTGTQSDAILANAAGLPGPITITNCTIANSLGKGVRTDALLFGSLRIVNSIITGSAQGQIGLPVIPGATIQVSNSIVQGGYPGAGNINADPRFVDPNGVPGDFRLQASSPAIDAGDNAALLTDIFGTPTLDLAGNVRRSDAPQVADTGSGGAPVVDIGAYEFIAPVICRADVNSDGSLGVQDIFTFLAAYFTSSASADFNQSGAVTLQDIFDFLAAYFAGCP